MPLEEAKILEEVRRRARAYLPPQAAGDEASFRADALEFFARIPQPPLYQRRNDTTRQTAVTHIDEGMPLLARAYATAPDLAGVLEQHLAALCLLAEGQVGKATSAWQRAMHLESAATAKWRLWHLTEERPQHVFDKGTGRSRFDARPEPTRQLQLPCPWCHKPNAYTLTPPMATYQLFCVSCAQAFAAYLATVESLSLKSWRGNRHQYTFTLKELKGTSSKIAFQHVGPNTLKASRRDTIVFLYKKPPLLSGILNLDTGRVLWLPVGGPCFLATAVFGEEAPQLVTLRHFRDSVLLPHPLGQKLVRCYYRHGPKWAYTVSNAPWLTKGVRAMLSCFTALIERLYTW